MHQAYLVECGEEGLDLAKLLDEEPPIDAADRNRRIAKMMSDPTIRAHLVEVLEDRERTHQSAMVDELTASQTNSVVGAPSS